MGTDEAIEPTLMAHYECERCEMQATVVRTVDASVEWMRHMDSHPGNKFSYRVWTWSVVPLDFSDDERHTATS